MWAFSIAQGAALVQLTRVFPPPSPLWTAERLAERYQNHSTGILIAAVLLGWTSGPMIQVAVVLWLRDIFNGVCVLMCALIAMYLATG